MKLTEDQALLRYYMQELAYLRRSGMSFAQRYPKIAARLELGENESPDPHVERLLEGFALLTGRVQYNIDSEFSIFTTALMENLYPHYLAPIPSMSIAQFDVDAEQGLLVEGFNLPKHTPLFIKSTEEITCRFRTCYPVQLWPFTVKFAGFEPTNRYDFLDSNTSVTTVLRLRLQVMDGVNLSTLLCQQLRFHLHGQWADMSQLYELLFCNVCQIALLKQDQTTPVCLPLDALTPVGFHDQVLPAFEHAHPAYRLLQEYFAFPEKFLFFDIAQLDKLNAAEGDEYFDLLFMLNQRPGEKLLIDAENFRLGCTPIINLFNQLTEPLRIHQRQTEYRLIPDLRREHSTEIHSIRRLSAISDESDTSRDIQPYFSFRHDMEGKEHRSFWSGRRIFSERADLPGTEILITFMDLDFTPNQPAQDTVFAHTLCTNRHLAEQVPANAALQIEAVAPLTHITCLNKPTPQLDPPLRGDSVWRLVSHLSLNHLSLTANSEESLLALRELLRLYQFAAPHKPIDRQVAGIRSLACKQSVERLGPDAWRGFVRGFEITLEFDDELYVGSSAFLLASVLNHFFPLYTSANSFTRLVIKNTRKEGIWKKWPSRTGEKTLL
ncbi:type VI secretion system baseplate subunit TssF [Candidatus Venteria ishoeyi]|uniref:Type VI secretion system baseplate subunit TssF n=1 Tax=Candidatus Venteria ishoeyi TaxID=1899563 RepID=A0A1H6FI34_9GAMM|nr:type VI secretion system baseplate subunit TssF [Candidatus Venteria ishoeyi]SEH09164.1 Uncharacterised protein [Candidatus Venteria ishoeyi]SEH09293.1 Uncharacterised protein [Candidatus Venteria ishoeyi]